MTGYQTQQRNLLVSFFESHPDEAFTIDEITRQMRSEQRDAADSGSSVLRTGAVLVWVGCLKRTYLADRRRSAYQYLDPHACAGHLHVRCEKCHALMHLDENVSDEIARLLQSNANVALDLSNTVLMGYCEACSHKN